MARRARVYTREFTPDARYNSTIVARLINKVMKDGRKRTAEGIKNNQEISEQVVGHKSRSGIIQNNHHPAEG